MVRYIRDMSFRQVFIAEILGKIIAFTVAISVIYLGGGYWAIATNSISSPVAAMLISYLLAPYTPALSLANLAAFSTFLGWPSMAQLVCGLELAV
jgi:membrane protein DedA with SNARE-associated domain